MRSAICFWLSLDAHLWAVLLLSQLPRAQERQPLEVFLLRLPAPMQGDSSQTPAESAATPNRLYRPRPETLPHKLPSPKTPAKEPRVAMKVVVRPAEEISTPQEARRENERKTPRQRPPSEPTPQETTRLDGRQQDTQRRDAEPAGEETALSPKSIFGSFTEKPPQWQPKENRSQAAGGLLPERAQYSAAAAAMAALAEQDPKNIPMPCESVEESRPARPQPELKIAGEGMFSLPARPEGGDTRPILDIIQARIDAVTPLVHRTAGPCKFLRGEARLEFRMQKNGYHQDHRLTRPSGKRCLDERIDEVLHLAEPYPYLAGWIPVYVRFGY